VLLKFPQPLERHFASPVQRVLRNSTVDWVLCALLPKVARVSYILCISDLSRLDSLERAFILASLAASQSGIGSKVDGQNEEFAEKLCAVARDAEHERSRSDLVAGITELFDRGRAELLEERHGIVGGDIPQIQTSSVRYDLVAKKRHVEGFLTWLSTRLWCKTLWNYYAYTMSDSRVHHDLGYTVLFTTGGTAHVTVWRSSHAYDRRVRFDELDCGGV